MTIVMEDLLHIVGNNGGLLTVANGSPLDVSINPNGTLRVGRVDMENGNNVYPLSLDLKDAIGVIRFNDSSGRPILSWSSSEKRVSHSAITAFTENVITTTSPRPSSAVADMSNTITRPSGSGEMPTLLSAKRPVSQPSLSQNSRSMSAAHSMAPQACSITPKQRSFMLKELRNLARRKDSRPFNDSMEMSLYPDYSIQRPMDFVTIYSNLSWSKSHYVSVKAIMADFDLVIDNALKYFDSVHEMSTKAGSIRDGFYERMKRLPDAHDDNDQAEDEELCPYELRPSTSTAGKGSVERRSENKEMSSSVLSTTVGRKNHTEMQLNPPTSRRKRAKRAPFPTFHVDEDSM